MTSKANSTDYDFESEFDGHGLRKRIRHFVQNAGRMPKHFYELSYSTSIQGLPSSRATSKKPTSPTKNRRVD